LLARISAGVRRFCEFRIMPWVMPKLRLGVTS
jgi:hypothetical protein